MQIWEQGRSYVITLTDISSPARSYQKPIHDRLVVGRSAAKSDICDIGLKRKVNQDSLLMADKREAEMYLFVVADGMGGHSDGELASKALTEGIRTWADAFSVKKYDGNFRNMMLSLQNRIEEINRKIYIEYNQSQICGSTCVVLLLFRNIYGVISAGDSRLYLRRGFKTTSFTTDDVWENQSSVQET